jgi:hypothetical protein
MSKRRRDPIDLLREANPESADALREATDSVGRRNARERAVALGEGGRDLLGEGESEGQRSRRLPSLPRPAAIGIGAAAASATAVVAIVVLGGGSVGPGKETAYAAEAVRIAEANPRLLVGEPGWTVTRADEFESDAGSMEFSDGTGKFMVDWHTVPAEYPADSYADSATYLPTFDQWYRLQVSCASLDGPDECSVFERQTRIDMLGQRATFVESKTVRTSGESSRFTVFMPSEDRYRVMITGYEMTRERFLDVLASVHATDVDTWLAALPERIVRPLERPEVVDEMLADVPVPSSVDVEALKGEASAASRYHLGAAVTSAVACAWLDQWAAAVKAGDTEAAQEATDAMSTSRDWAILREMEDQGGWSQVIWEYAGQMRRDERQALLGSGGTETLPNGSTYEIRPAYATGIGCDSERRVLREEGTGPKPPPFPDPIPVDAPVLPNAQP